MSKGRVPGFDQVNFFFLNQNDVVLVKKKVNKLQPSFWPRRRVTLGFAFLNFFLNPARFQFQVGRVNPPGRPKFQNYGLNF